MAKKCFGNDVDRRGFLHVGLLGGLGLTLDDFFRLRQAQADIKQYESKEGTAKSVIFIFLPEGIAHQESFDPKPYAPVDYRGPLGTIGTKLTGLRFSELFKQTAQVADKLALCRTLHHGEAAHERGTHNMFTGYRPSPALQYPHMGAVVSHEFGPRHDLPPYVCMPTQPNEFAGTGFLSSSYACFSLGADPARDNFKVRDLNLPGGVTEARFARRRRLLDRVNAMFATHEKSDALSAVDTFCQRAYSLIGSPQARQAFDISKEDPKLRDRYGRNQAGGRMLLARRLVAAGVRFVTLTYGTWDLHNNIKPGMVRQVPPLDQAFATLYHCLGIVADKELMAPGGRPIEIVKGGKVRKELLG